MSGTTRAEINEVKPDVLATDSQRREALKRELLLRRLKESGAAAKSDGHSRSIGSADRSLPLPISWAQQGLWFLDQLDGAAGAAYHIPVALRLTGNLDRDALQSALDSLVARHEILRTSFPADDDGVRQNIAPRDAGFSLQIRDLRNAGEAAMSAEGREHAVLQIATEEFDRPFDLATGPLIRGQLLWLDEHEHVLLLTQHHIVSDGWSIGIIVKEITTLYRAYCDGKPDPLEPLAIQYADYAAWQRERLHGKLLQDQIDFWNSHLSGAPALLNLPTDRPRPPEQSYQGGTVELSLPSDLSQGLRKLAQENGATLFMVLLAGWASFLSRISQQKDVVIGTTVANRERAETAALVGYFVNTLALRATLNDELSVAQLIAQVKDVTMKAYAHQELPFERVVEALKPERDLSHSPLFQAMFSLNNTPKDKALVLPGIAISALHIPNTTTHFDLTLALNDQGDALAGSIEYASDLFDRSTVERLSQHFQTLLHAMVADSAQQIALLPLMESEQRKHLLQHFSCANNVKVEANEHAPAAPHGFFHQLFEAHALLHPDAPALQFLQEKVSYAQLNQRANRVAHQLLSRGIVPDQRVAICMERSVEMLVAVLAVLKAGAAYVPFDPAYPKDRLKYMWNDSAPAAMLVHEATLECVRPMIGDNQAVDILVLDRHSGEHAMLLSASPLHDANPDPALFGLRSEHLCYIIYTSGSTGLPKGVMCVHRGLYNLATVQQSAFTIPHDSRVLQFASFSFDASVWEFVMALAHGACLHMGPREAMLPGAPLLQVLREHGITHATLPSSALAVLPRDEELPPTTLIVAGDAFPPALAAQWSGKHRLFNGYGPTENSVCSSLFLCPPGHDGKVPIGRPAANVCIYLLDQHLQPVPQGVTGELYLGGLGIARGYWNRPELTAERFIQDPFSTDPAARLYKSGDLGRWLADGNLEFLGRNDSQVKVRGFRIEIGEIEQRLAACDDVQEAIVIARKTHTGESSLVGYVVMRDESAFSIGELRRQLSVNLADHMIPGQIVALPRLPLTTNGKVDYKALPPPDNTFLSSLPYEEPQGVMEERLASIWSALLGVERIGRHNNFLNWADIPCWQCK